MSARKYLLIARVGDRSLHPYWLTKINDQTRTWDLHLSYFGDKADAYADRPADVTMTRERLKYPGIVDCLAKLGDRVAEYDYVGFPDDDLYCRGTTWNRFLQVVEQYKPLVAQPALKTGSFYSYDGVLERREFLLRWTSFVEVMAPFFSRSALVEARPYFTENKSGWGMDYLWPKLFKAENHTMCVVDSTPVLHTRAIGVGPLYSLLSKSSDGPAAEMAAFLERYQLKAEPLVTLAGVSRAGGAVAATPESQQPRRMAERLQRTWVNWRLLEFKPYQMQLLAG